MSMEDKGLRHSFVAVFAMAVLAVGAYATPVPSGKSLDKVSLQLKWKHQFQFAGFYAAIEKGFYEEAGLEVTIIEGGPGIDFIETVVSGEAEYGVEMADLLLRRVEGAPVVVLACIYQHSPIALMSLAESNIRSPHDLIGHKIMLRPETEADLRAMISHEGIKPGVIEMIDHSFNLEDLINGKVDAMSLYSTAYAGELKSRGIAFNSLTPISYGVDFYGDCLFTSEEEIEKHPRRVRDFRGASLKGWEYAMNNPDEIAELIHEKYAPGKSVEVLLSEAEEMEPLLLHKVIEIGHINPGRWKHIGDTFVSQGMLNSDYSLDGFIYEPFGGKDYRWLYLVLGLLGGVVFVGGLARFWNKRLHIAVSQRTRELSESEERLKGMFANISSAVAIYKAIDDGKDFVFIDFNPAGERIEKIAAKDVIGKAVTEVFPGAEKFGILGVFRRVWQSGKAENYPVSMYHDGRIQGWRENFIYRLASGEIVAIYDDVTERKQAEAALSESYERFEVIMDSLDSVVYVADFITYELLFINKYGRNIWGDIVGEKCWQSIQSGFAEPCEFCTNELLLDENGKSTGVHTWEFRNTVNNRWYECRDQAIPWTDGRLVRMEIATDITERKRAEEEREQLYKSLEFKNRELQDVVYTASHDLRSPLVNIEGFGGELKSACGDLLGLISASAEDKDKKEKIESLLNEEIPESLSFITGSVKKMSGLLDGLLQVSRIGTVEMKSESIDMNAMISEVLEAMEYQIKENDIAVRVDSLGSCPGDASMLDQVFTNLIGNAIKYRDPGKKGEIRISGEANGSMNIYCVEDNGMGIASNHQEKVFEIFHRLNPNDDIGGEGLGLTIVTRILDRMGGRIWLESKPGKGSKFFVGLPKVS